MFCERKRALNVRILFEGHRSRSFFLVWKNAVPKIFSWVDSPQDRHAARFFWSVCRGHLQASALKFIMGYPICEANGERSGG